MRVPHYPSADPVRWSAVDDYFADLLAPSDAHLRAVLVENSGSGLPPADVSATQGKMLALFARMVGANVSWKSERLVPTAQYGWLVPFRLRAKS